MLAKILGVYRIGYRNTQTNQALRQDLLVMENLFYNRKVNQVQSGRKRGVIGAGPGTVRMEAWCNRC